MVWFSVAVLTGAGYILFLRLVFALPGVRRWRQQSHITLHQMLPRTLRASFLPPRTPTNLGGKASRLFSENPVTTAKLPVLDREAQWAPGSQEYWGLESLIRARQGFASSRPFPSDPS